MTCCLKNVRTFIYIKRLCFGILSAANNNPQPLSRNEYRLPPATGSQTSSSRLIGRDLPALPSERDNRPAFNFPGREPPPSYWASYRNQPNQLDQQRTTHRQRRPAPAPPISRSQAQQIALRSRVEQFRNRISVSDTESDDDRGRRSRILSPRRNLSAIKNEVLLGE